MNRRASIALLLAVSVFSSACASTVRINSTPEGAQVFVDGAPVGYTPTTYTDTGIVFSQRQVEVRMDGYEVHRATLRRDAELNVGAVVVGFLCLYPLWLWALDYPSQVHYQLRPLYGDESGNVDGLVVAFDVQ
jgi:hypothetical protein